VIESVRGELLVAGPALAEPNFWRTVVLVVEHSEEGALGLVLNRPSHTTVGEAVPQLEPLVEPEEQLFVGGPVRPSAVLVLAEFEDPADAGLLAFDNVGVLGLEASPEEAPAGLRCARAFAGHAGWGAGQLDSELGRGDWMREPARREDAFSPAPAGLWSEVLTRKGGSYALVARMPADPSLN
jgi:putative transcriptional regulator